MRRQYMNVASRMRDVDERGRRVVNGFAVKARWQKGKANAKKGYGAQNAWLK